MTYAVIPDDDPVALEFCSIPRVPEGLSAEEAASLWAAISASDIPDHAKGKLRQQIDFRLAEAAGKIQPAPATSPGICFDGASPDEVMRGLKKLAEQR